MNKNIESNNQVYSRHGRSEYNKLGVYDNIDVQSDLSLNRKVPKTKLDNFFYKKEVSELKESINSTNKNNFNSNSNDTTIFKPAKKSSDKITNTHLISSKFNICLDDLKFSSKNHLEYKLTDCFNINKILGEGSFGLVVEATLRTECMFSKELPEINGKYDRSKVALKIIPLINKSYSENFKEEASLLKKFEHENLVKVYSLFENTDYIVIEFELMEGESLRNLIIEAYADNSKDYLFKEEECACIIRGLLEGLSYLHKNGIFHRDIKPENLMFKKKDDLSSLKIIDFGLSEKFTSKLDIFHDSVGTLLYMPPEICAKIPSYNYLVDSWAAGFVLYILLSGGEHPLSTYKFWNNGEFDEKKYIEKLISKENWSFPVFFSK